LAVVVLCIKEDKIIKKEIILCEEERKILKLKATNKYRQNVLYILRYSSTVIILMGSVISLASNSTLDDLT
jgi:hypothetical protein